MNKFLLSTLSLLLITSVYATESFDLKTRAQQVIESPEMQKSLAAGSRGKWLEYLSNFISGNSDTLNTLSMSFMQSEADKDAFGAVSLLISESMGNSFYTSLGLKAEWDDLMSMKDRINTEDPVAVEKAQKLQRGMFENFPKLSAEQAEAVKKQAEADIMVAVNLLITLLNDKAA